MSDSVPFGKYKGRPVEDMLADADYMTWLEAQPWFRERYGNLLAKRDQDAMSRTPVHNRLQVLFLKPAYCAALAVCVGAPNSKKFLVLPTSGWTEAQGSKAWVEKTLASDYDEKIKAQWRQVGQELETCQPRLLIKNTTFETGLADVVIHGHNEFPVVVCDWSGRRNPKIEWHKADLQIRVELKPTVADEYPAVLRQMDRHRTNVLFLGNYTGEGATEQEFVAIFNASGKDVVFKRDVDALVAKE